MELVKHETCPQYVTRRLSEGWRIIEQDGFLIVLQSPEGTIRPVDLRNDIETLRPNATGAETTLNPNDTVNWQMVDEAEADDETTTVGNYTHAAYNRDLYGLPASSGSGTINKITVHFRCWADHTDCHAKASIRSDTTTTDGAEKTFAQAEEWENFSQEWAQNPADSEDWEWSDMDALQIGVSLEDVAKATILCTQVYVEVDYTEAAPETYIKTVSIDALLKATDTSAIDLDTLLRATDAEVVDLDALLRGTVLSQVDIDALLEAIDTKTVDLDALLRALGITKTAALDILLRTADFETVNLDGLIRKLGITKIIALDVLLGKVGVETVDLDALLRGIADKTVDLDALIRKVGDTRTIDLDALIALVNLTKSVTIDTLLEKTDSKTIDLDAYLRALNVLQTIDLDALIQATGITKAIALDVLLATIMMKSIDLDALIQALGITKTVALDVILGGAITLTIDLDALIQATVSKTIQLDVILRAYPSGALGYIIEVRDSSGNLLVILKHATSINLIEQLNLPPMLDFNLPADDSKISHISPDNEIWLRDYETGTLIKKFLISRRRDTRE